MLQTWSSEVKAGIGEDAIGARHTSSGRTEWGLPKLLPVYIALQLMFSKSALRAITTRQWRVSTVNSLSNIRSLSLSPHNRNAQPVEETQDVRELDRLLNVVRERSAPAFRS